MRAGAKFLVGVGKPILPIKRCLKANLITILTLGRVFARVEFYFIYTKLAGTLDFRDKS